jgi:hypothetical protein
MERNPFVKSLFDKMFREFHYILWHQKANNYRVRKSPPSELEETSLQRILSL